MPKTWYVKVDGRTNGPLPSSRLVALAKSGGIDPSTPVSADGEQWTTASSVKGLPFGLRALEEALGMSSAPDREVSSKSEEGLDLAIGDGAQDDEAFGFTAEPVSDADRMRADAYVREWGRRSEIYREVRPAVPAVDVLTYLPSEHREATTLATSGMSDSRMPVPPGAGSPRAELVLYVDQPNRECASLLSFLARIPYRHRTWFAIREVRANGEPPQPIFSDSVLDGFLFMPAIVGDDHTFHERFSLGGDPVELLWVVPITAAERSLAETRGFDALLDLLDRNRHPALLDPQRKCYVTGRG